ncbi:hypothetical protein [Pedobacter metabolipauper]|uniref:DUF5018 domain-containing protein n=1 Tax=Pedobacter metabolipauper TaxID=425513 RepID=A0A4R6SYM1_9SPHI|nr:hypothetical protein [Pedobacter metabolipauper]TDQ09782.1 hypothetical protein ATK78_1941 [Pedobacter metabolipauper]
MKPNFLICALLALISFASCKKNMSLPEQPNSKILEFKVPVSDGMISGAIDETDKTITVYIPFFYQLDVIDPVIRLSEGAKLSEEILPVDVLNDKATYTVTGADKSTTTYKLIIKMQQMGPLVVSEVSTETTTASWGIGFYMLNIRGNFNTNDANKVRVFLVDANEKEAEMTHVTGYGNATVVPQMGTEGKIYTLGYIGVPQTLDPGRYKVRVKVQSLTTDLKYPVTLNYVLPQIDYESITAKQGDTFVIHTTGPVFHNFKTFSVPVNGVKVEFPIVSYTRTHATIRVPDTMTPGTYYPYLLFDGFPQITANWPLTIIAK